MPIFFSQAPIARLMRKSQLCYECTFWKQYISNPISGTFIVNGKLYKGEIKQDFITGNKRNNKVLLRELKTGNLMYCTSPPVLISKVPERFRDELPDKYGFISSRTYKLLLERCTDCLAKGCWDRYYCFWYNASKAEPKQPWNEIPHYHKPGDEKCESFINKLTMYDIKI